MKTPYLCDWQREYLKRYRDGEFKRTMFIDGYELSIACRNFRKEMVQAVGKTWAGRLFERWMAKLEKKLK